MVDLDDSAIIKCCGDEGTILPQRLIKSLKISLNLAVSSATVSEADRNVLISDAFMNFFVKVCGHYSKFILVCDGQKIFDVSNHLIFFFNKFCRRATSGVQNEFMFAIFYFLIFNGIVFNSRKKHLSNL